MSRQSTGFNTKLNQAKIVPANNQNNSQDHRSLSTSSDVFNSSIEMDENTDSFITPKPKNTSNHNLSSTDTSELEKTNQCKQIFLSRY